ncbi:MAG TPA: ribosome-associated translation inhibitor RaiA [Actinomycetales bacterium]|nr:ribosome-associated translation inhibitor RaiA [Actinomycetales bacterium]
MEIVVTARHVEVKERYRQHLEEKLAKVPQIAPRIQRLDVVVSHEPNRRQSDVSERVEITTVGKGPVVRAEAAADDPYVALDRAYAKLLERLRRAHDRKCVRRGKGAPESVAQATARLSEASTSPEPTSDGVTAAVSGLEDSPVQIREKVHRTSPMSLAQALYEMELVGHDFYLYCDADTNQPSVVYRRRGWEYGVLHLDVQDADEAQPTSYQEAAAG